MGAGNDIEIHTFSIDIEIIKDISIDIEILIYGPSTSEYLMTIIKDGTYCREIDYTLPYSSITPEVPSF